MYAACMHVWLSHPLSQANYAPFNSRGSTNRRNSEKQKSAFGDYWEQIDEGTDLWEFLFLSCQTSSGGHELHDNRSSDADTDTYPGTDTDRDTDRIISCCSYPRTARERRQPVMGGGIGGIGGIHALWIVCISAYAYYACIVHTVHALIYTYVSNVYKHTYNTYIPTYMHT